MTSSDHSIILWTLIFAAIATAIALITTILAYKTAKYAKDAITPLNQTVAGLINVAELQNATIQTADRIHKSEKLLRQIEVCGKALDTLLSISEIGVHVPAEVGDDPDEIAMWENAEFLVPRRRLLATIHQLPAGMLPKTAIVADLDKLGGSDADVEAARQEVVDTLKRLQAEMQKLAEGGLLATKGKPAPRYQVNHGRPTSWASVIIIIAGFVVGGAGLIAGPTWWLFGAGAGLAFLGGIVGLGTGIFNDWY